MQEKNILYNRRKQNKLRETMKNYRHIFNGCRFPRSKVFQRDGNR